MPELNRELTVIERFRDSHHNIARMFASEMTPSMIRQRTGISTRRLSLLWADPTFQELITYYRKDVAEKWDASMDAFTDLGVGNMLRAESIIADKLNSDDAEELPLLTLDKISQGRADRFGYSKHSIHHHEHSFAEALDRAIARSGEVKQIEAQAVEVVSTPEPAIPLVLHEAKPPRKAKALPPSFARVLGPVKRRRVA